MKSHFVLLCAVVMVANSSSAFGAEPSSASASTLFTDPLVIKVQNAALTMQRKSWEQGVLATAFVEAGEYELAIQLAKASSIYTSKNGVVAALDGAPVDPLMAGEAVWLAAKLTGDPALRKNADDMLAWTLNIAPRATDGTLYHAGRTIWSDSFHTSPPFLAKAGHYDEAVRQIEGHWKRLWNREAKLISHIWDEQDQKFADKSFWGGGNGWAAAGLTRVIRALPTERKRDKERLIGYLKELIDGCIAHQNASGLFPNTVNDPTSFEETNLAQMLAYSIYESVSGGWLQKDYLTAAERMRAAARAKVDDYGFVQGVCGAPEFSKPGISPEGQAFFLMMEAAARKLGQVAPAVKSGQAFIK